jgi:hypothetical protein
MGELSRSRLVVSARSGQFSSQGGLINFSLPKTTNVTDRQSLKQNVDYYHGL